MDTSTLIKMTQSSLTKAMMLRSAPSGGLPIGFRALMIALGEETIMKGEAFAAIPANVLTGRVTEKYYIAGEGTLGKDIASMSDEPFSLLTPYRSAREGETDIRRMDRTPTFKLKMTGGNTAPKYMMVQLSRLGYEYLKNMEYFPKTYDIYNKEKVGLNIKSHVPAELLRTTVLRTQGKGADMYPMNPSELFYTMYELIEYGYDIPVEKLSNFNGFDLGSPYLIQYMKPEALYSLFNIGICSFTCKVDYDIDIEGGKIIFKSFPFKLRGNTYRNQIDSVVKRKNGVFDTFRVSEKNIFSHITTGKAIEMTNVLFHTWDLEEIKRDIEINFHKQIYINYYHFAHEVEIIIEDELEQDYKMDSKSVRETLITCIENFKEITKSKYLGEAEKIRSKVQELIIYEKVTRPYVGVEVQKLLRESDYVRSKELKRVLDEYHKSDPEKYPLITQEEIDDYIWYKDGGNLVLAHMNDEGYLNYRKQIENELKAIAELERKALEENIIKEAKELFYQLSQEEEFRRKSPVRYINSTIDIGTRERIADFVSIYEDSNILSKIHYYGENGVVKTDGKNLPKGAIPYYTLHHTDITIQDREEFYNSKLHHIPKLGEPNYLTGDLRCVMPEGKAGLYITNTGRFSVNHTVYPIDGTPGMVLMPGEFVIDYLPLNDYINVNTLEVTNPTKVLIVKDNYLYLEDLSEIMTLYGNVGHLPMEKYEDVRAIEIVSDEKDFENMYIWCITERKLVRMSDVLWDELRVPLNEVYFPGYIISNNKQAYIDGIHVPLNILKDITGIDLNNNKFIFEYNMPEGIGKYIANISSNPDENSKEEIENLKQIVKSKVDAMIRSTELTPSETQLLSGVDFIREI